MRCSHTSEAEITVNARNIDVELVNSSETQDAKIYFLELLHPSLQLTVSCCYLVPCVSEILTEKHVSWGDIYILHLQDVPAH